VFAGTIAPAPGYQADLCRRSEVSMSGATISFPARRKLSREADDCMGLAFDKAWRSVRSDALQDPSLARARMAAAILALAESGEHDPDLMAAGALDAVLRRDSYEARPR
jgi:hypothetical protein